MQTALNTWRPRLLHSLACALLASVLGACSGGGGGGVTAGANNASAAVPAPVQAAVAASVPVKVEVPTALAAAPFDTDRHLVIPPGFGIRLWARVNKARFMALAPTGDLLVSRPDNGTIVLLRERANDTPQEFTFASGLHNPHDMVFHQIGDVVYLYIAESNRISRAVYRAGDTSLGERQVLIDGLPDNSTPELQGAYGHELKNIALGPDHKLYVSIASTCNACVEDTASNPVRGAIYQYNADGTGGRLFARGLRNAEGLDFLPGTNLLWAAVNNRDNIKFPFDADIDGDGNSDLGKVVPAYVDVNPPEPFTVVQDGANYGWPFCNAVPNATMSNLDTVADYDLNRNNTVLNCGLVTKTSKGIRAHSAPLGLSFLHASNMPAAYRKGAAIALHGCWNCTTLSAGYKVVYFPFDDAGNAGNEMDLITGFVTNPEARTLWGRPVDVIPDARGGLFVSDDYAGAIYQLYPR
jgi:glucose/arabinose dehydrogenase